MGQASALGAMPTEVPLVRMLLSSRDFFSSGKIFQIIKGSLAAGAGTNAVCQLKAMAPGTASAVENVDFGSPVLRQPERRQAMALEAPPAPSRVMVFPWMSTPASFSAWM